MFFRRVKPTVPTFDSHLGDLRAKGFSVAAKGPGVAIALRDGCAAVLQDAGAEITIEKTGVLMGHEIGDRKSTRLNSSHLARSRMPSSA